MAVSTRWRDSPFDSPGVRSLTAVDGSAAMFLPSFHTPSGFSRKDDTWTASSASASSAQLIARASTTSGHAPRTQAEAPDASRRTARRRPRTESRGSSSMDRSPPGRTDPPLRGRTCVRAGRPPSTRRLAGCRTPSDTHSEGRGIAPRGGTWQVEADRHIGSLGGAGTRQCCAGSDARSRRSSGAPGLPTIRSGETRCRCSGRRPLRV